MALQQPGTGYRDPSKAMTIKALQERQKAAAAAALRATAIPEGPMTSPFQGIAQLTGVLSSQMQENRAASQEASARDQLSQIIAGVDPDKGPTPEQYAQMRSLDPELADRQYEAAIAERRADENRAAENAFTTSERVAGQGFTSSERVAGEAADISKLGVQDKFGDENAVRDAKIAETAAVTADTRGDENAVRDAKIKAEQEKAAGEAKIAAIPAETEARKAEWLKLNPNGDINSPEAQSYILRNAAETTGGFGGPAGLKAMQDWHHEANSFSSGLDSINEAKALVPKALTGDIGRKVAEWASSLGEGGITAAVAASNSGMAGMLPDFMGELKGLTRDQIEATVRLYGVLDKISNLQMSGTLKGTSTDREMANFQKIFANPAATPEMKLTALMDLERAFSNDRNILSNTIQTAGGQALTPYEYRPVNPQTEAPADAGAGGTDEPHEGDIFTSPGKPDLVYRNGQYVPVGTP